MSFIAKMMSPTRKKKIYAQAVRIGMNLWPCIRRSGGRITYLSDDFTQLTVQVDLTWKTRNRVGTIFGGSLYAATDPFYMLMLMEILGRDFVVWDKGCTIRFKRPAKETLFADFHITPQMLQQVRDDVEKNQEVTLTWPLALKNQEGVVFAEFDKVLYVAKKSFYHKKRPKNGSAAAGTGA